MDSWSYERSVFFVKPSDSFDKNTKVITGFDQRLSNELENDDVLISGFACMAAKSNGFTDVEKNHSSSIKLSSVATEELTRIDFKLGRFLDYRKNDTSFRAFALPSKKPCSSEKPLCQVYGCNMDLSFSKDYHKRHKVCEAHSKTSVVIVNGIEQRFCQQCSRFHFLSEFDDGKRSCRRRLADHNERRRKPSFCFLPGKRHKLLRTSQDKHDHCASRLLSFKDEPMFRAIGRNNSRIYKSKPEACGVSSIGDLHEAASRSTCALSLLSAQSQLNFSQIPDTTFSIIQPNQNLNQQMKPLWIDPVSSSCNGKGSSTVDLLQLSSHLKRIEQQRNFTDEAKQEHNNILIPLN